MKQLLFAGLLALLLLTPVYAADSESGVLSEAGQETIHKPHHADDNGPAKAGAAAKEIAATNASAAKMANDNDKQTPVNESEDGIKFDLYAEDNLGDAIVAILAVTLSLGMPIIIVALAFYAAYRKRKQRLELIAKFVDNDREIPVEILANLDGFGATKSNLRNGLLAMGIGLGVILGLGILAGWEVGALGLIPFCIGLSQLLIWKLEDDEA